MTPPPYGAVNADLRYAFAFPNGATVDAVTDVENGEQTLSLVIRFGEGVATVRHLVYPGRCAGGDVRGALAVGMANFFSAAHEAGLHPYDEWLRATGAGGFSPQNEAEYREQRADALAMKAIGLDEGECIDLSEWCWEMDGHTLAPYGHGVAQNAKRND